MNIPIHGLVAACAASFASASLAQAVQASQPLPAGQGVLFARSAGDTTGDGVQDVVAVIGTLAPGNPFVIDGATGATLHALASPIPSTLDAAGIGDANSDGRSDVALVGSAQLRVYSGSTGALLYSVNPPAANQSYSVVCPAGDHDGNGTADIGVVTQQPPTATWSGKVLHILRGENGTPISSNNLPQYAPVKAMRPLGDVNGDGRSDFALHGPHPGIVGADGITGVSFCWITSSSDNDRVATHDVDGDGKREILVTRPSTTGNPSAGLFTVHDPAFGVVRRTFPLNTLPFGASSPHHCTVSPVGDLDQDGHVDFAFSVGNMLRACSGSIAAPGRTLWEFSHPLGAIGGALVPVGDVDSDGCVDFFCQSPNGKTIVSSRTLANTLPLDGACGGGPFFPRLGATRPILGQSMTIAGQDGPPATPGVLVLSLRPAQPFYMGASTCVRWFDTGSALPVLALTQPQWTTTLAVPASPAFTAFEFALQHGYAPTTGPLGFDLGNGVVLRPGWQ